MALAASKPCPICLNSISDMSFLDPCFHCFCFHCILQWKDMVFTHPSLEGKTELDCPLCRRPSSCIIHSVILDTFQRHYLFGDSPSQGQPFSLSSSHYHRLYVYKNSLHTSVAQFVHQKIKHKAKVVHISGNVNVQQWAEREQWVRRDLQALMQVEDVVLITQLVLGILKSYEEKQRVDLRSSTIWMDAMLDAVKPFLFENAEIFCVELHTFLCSGLNVKAFDQLVEEILTENTLKLLPTAHQLRGHDCSSQEVVTD